MTGRTSQFVLVAALLLAAALPGGVFAQDNGFVCAKECHEINCDSANIRYGKYCGVGHGGCEGEEPCDEVDECCKQHDECVDRTGMLSLQANTCHAKFIKCLERQEKKKGARGFSETCPYQLVIPAMKNGIQLAMALTNMFAGQEKREL